MFSVTLNMNLDKWCPPCKLNLSPNIHYLKTSSCLLDSPSNKIRLKIMTINDILDYESYDFQVKDKPRNEMIIYK